MRQLGASRTAILAILLSTSALGADEPAATATFTLQRIGSKSAATLLRTIVGTRELLLPDDHTLKTTDHRARLELAGELLAAIDTAEIVASQSFTTGDETVIAVVPLRVISPAAAMQAMRKLEIHKIATLAEPPTIVVRDTPEQVTLAVDALAAVDQQQD